MCTIDFIARPVQKKFIGLVVVEEAGGTRHEMWRSGETDDAATAVNQALRHWELKSAQLKETYHE